IRWLGEKTPFPESPLRDWVAAVSVGIVDGRPSLDLCYAEDSTAQVDLNLVMTGPRRIVENQGTAEGEAFSEREMATMMTLGKSGIKRLIQMQRRTLGLKQLPALWT